MEKENINDGVLTPENVVIKLRQYVDSLKRSVTNKPYPINRDILIDFSFYMDYAINRTNLVVVNKIHDIITSYCLGC